MPRTRVELARAAVRELSRVGSGQAPDDEDVDLANEAIDDFAAFLETADIYTINDFEEIENAAFKPLAIGLAWWIARDFIKQRLVDDWLTARQMLVLIQAGRPSYETLAVDYF